MKKKKGFTLIELIAAIAILSIAMVGISNAIFFGSNVSAKNTKKVNTSVFAQYMIQTYKSQGKNYIKSLYSGNSFTGYCYFNNLDELNDVLEGTAALTPGSYQNMIDGKTASNKSIGAYVEFTSSSIIGKVPGSNSDIVLQPGFDNVRIYVKVVNLKEQAKNESSLVFFLGR